MTPRPAFDERLAHLDRPRQENAFGEPIEPTSVDDITVGWLVSHATDRYEVAGDLDEHGTDLGTYKCGVVVDLYERDGLRYASVVEDRMVERRLIVRRHDWLLSELNLDRCEPVSSTGRHGAAKKMCAAVGANIKGAWSFTTDDFLVASALAVTEPERAKQVAVTAAKCASGHCTDAGGDCEAASDHLGVCCWCGVPVGAKKRNAS